MANRFDIQLLGLPALEARLRAAPLLVERGAVDYGLMYAATVVRAVARARIQNRTGRLAATLNIRRNHPRPGRLGWSVWSGTNAQLGGGNRAGPKWYYPMHLHTGHAYPYQGPLSIGSRSARYNRRRRTQRRVSPRPFLREALLQNRAYIFQIIASGMSRQLASLGF